MRSLKLIYSPPYSCPSPTFLSRWVSYLGFGSREECLSFFVFSFKLLSALLFSSISKFFPLYIWYAVRGRKIAGSERKGAIRTTFKRSWCCSDKEGTILPFFSKLLLTVSVLANLKTVHFVSSWIIPLNHHALC